VIFDSCRFDAFIAAKPKVISKLGEVEKRYSYASWTAPSHYNCSWAAPPPQPDARVRVRLLQEGLPQLQHAHGLGRDRLREPDPAALPATFMRNRLGYFTNAMVSLPVLNPKTIINKDFDTFKLMPKHNDMAAMVSR
jgi:hypothetical protein